MKSKGKRSLNLKFDVDLYDFFAKLCIDLGVTKTEAITQYFQYLKKLHNKKRRLLSENSEETFRVDAK